MKRPAESCASARGAKEKDQKLPALQFYPGDWFRDMGVQSLSFHDRGVWFHMLLMMHGSERRGVLVLNGRAMSVEMIARTIGLDIQTFEQTLTNLLDAGVASTEPETGAIMNRRMVRDENLRKVRAKAGLMGGNPALVKQSRTFPHKQDSTPSSSSSFSDSMTIRKMTLDLPSWLPLGAWEAYQQMRESMKARLTARAVTLAVEKLERLKNEGNDPAAVLEQSVLNGWRGLFPITADRGSCGNKTLPAQAGAPLSPEVTEARRISCEYDECLSYWKWESMSEKYKQANLRRPPAAWHEAWQPEET